MFEKSANPVDNSNMKCTIYIYTISFPVLIGLSLVACDIDPQSAPVKNTKETPGQTQSDSKQPNDSLNKKTIASFVQLEHKANDALRANQMGLCRQLVNKGLKQTQAAGREFDLYEARFSILRGKIENKQGRSTDARRHYADAMAIFRIGKNAQGTFEVHLAQATLEESTGDYAAAQREINEAKKLLSKIDSQQLKGAFVFEQASLLSRQMKHSEAAKLFLEAAKLFQSIEEKTREADSYIRLSACEESMDKPRQSKRSLEKAYKIYTGIKNKEGAAQALHKLALISLREERIKTAKEQLKRVEALYIELDRQSDANKVNQHLSALPE